MTWAKLSSREALLDVCRGNRWSLSAIILRDGTIYFLVLLVMNVLHLALSLLAIAGDEETSSIIIFTYPMTTILVSHFLLQLQEANHRSLKVDSDNTLHMSQSTGGGASSFPRIVGSIDSMINVGSDADGDRDKDETLNQQDEPQPQTDEERPRDEPKIQETRSESPVSSYSQ
ncbi:hypothetical protein C8Q76DRAFT_337900 [Earliella scabrosa]|nr:hypothetical protein C8Q76DRAFT_337900 [Earliella scabrosa]